MLRITIELLPKGSEANKRHLGTARIWNEGSGTKDVGNYGFELSKWGKPDSVWKKGYLSDFPRLKLGPWDLLYQVLREAVEGRNK